MHHVEVALSILAGCAGELRLYISLKVNGYELDSIHKKYKCIRRIKNEENY